MLTFKGEEAIVLRNDTYEVIILPNRGAKIASIVYLPLQLELLSQLEEEAYQSKPDPHKGFTHEDSTGFDDMFPSILRGQYCWNSGNTTPIQDHGNVWYRPWKCNSISSIECLCFIEIPEFSCLLEKCINLSEKGLHIAYALTNNSDETFNGLWAAHALFAMRKGMFLHIDESAVEIINAMENSSLGDDSFGNRITYSIPSKAWDNLVVFDPESHSFAKYYFAHPSDISRISIVDPSHFIQIHIDYDYKATPYLGIWKNEKGWAEQINVGIEPATSGMDSPNLAKKFGMSTGFPPHETTVWDLRISVEPN